MAQRYHDALQEGCELLIRAKMVPDRAGSDTRVDVQIPLSALRGMPGAPTIKEAWLRARAGQHGYLQGKDAEAAACDALIAPMVTGAPDWNAITQMITLITDHHNRHRGPGEPPWPRSLLLPVTEDADEGGVGCADVAVEKSPAAVRLRGSGRRGAGGCGRGAGQESVTSVTAAWAACSSTMALPAA